MKTARRMATLFDGLKRAYGTYRITGVDGSKQVGEAVTVTGEVTDQLWLDHLAGKNGIGVVPIRDDSSCRFGAIDVDKYVGLDAGRTIKEIRHRKIPLVPCRSKSGGLHLYLFSREFITAAEMRGKLAEIAASLGFGGSEIFPKQNQVLADRGDIGSWINMPYFDAEKTTRYGYDDAGGNLTVEKFLDLAEGLACDVKSIKVEKKASKGDFTDGPVCLQRLVEEGVEVGMRNDVLFNIGIYLRKALPKNWAPELEKVNQTKFRPPLDSREVGAVVKGVGRTGCFYACKKPFLKEHCDRGVCRTRKFGIGDDDYFPMLTGLTKYNTVPPCWFLDVEEGGRLELTTEDLQNQLRFQRRCMDVLNRVTPLISPPQWQALLRALMEKVTIIEVPSDASTIGQLIDHLETFCTGKAQAKTKEEILLGKPWLSDGWHYFRLSDFLAHLERIRFYEFKVHQVARLIRDRGGRHEFMKLRGKGCNLWKIPEIERREETKTEDSRPMGDVI
jgi:hypothetical protein